MTTQFLKNEDAATAIEYGLIAAAMGLALIAIMPLVENALKVLFSSLAVHITTGK